MQFKHRSMFLPLGAWVAAALITTLHATAQILDGGGADGVGEVSDPCSLPTYAASTCASALEDISATGTLAPDASNTDDSVDFDIPIGFGFPFFQNSYSKIHIAANGCVGFSPYLFGTTNNVAMPNPALPNDMMCPLWDDLDPSEAGDVFYQTLTNPTRFVIQWNNVRRFGAIAGANTFQVILFSSGDIEFRYGALDGSPPLTANAGIEDSSGTFGLSIDTTQIGTGNTCRLIHPTFQCGACCLTSGGCEIRPEGTCPSQVGQYHGAGTTCGDGDGDGVADLCDNCPGIANSNQDDADSDGVGNACDQCAGTVPGATVDANGCPPPIPADFDIDGDVDGDDLDLFDFCNKGPGVPHPAITLCQEADFDNDNDVDSDDFGVYQRCYSGHNNPANPGCGQ